jgi:hypothetical protein
MEIKYTFLHTRILFYPPTPQGGYKNINTKKSPLGDLGVKNKFILFILKSDLSRDKK